MAIERKYYLLFWLIFIALSIHFKFYNIIFLAPQSTDMWRQADCLSIAVNYMQHGFNFFKPELHFLLNENGYAAGECPLIYFAVAGLFKLFGVKYFLFRGFNLIIFCVGLFYLFKLSFLITKNLYYSFIVCIIFFCTPIIFFYANNYLSDVPSLSFNITAFYFFLKYREERKSKQLIVSMLCFALAGLLKANASMLLIAVFCSTFVENFFTNKTENTNEIIRKKNNQALLFILFSIAIISSWYIYAVAFNKSNSTIFFGTKAMNGWPIWELSFNQFIDSLRVFNKLTLDIVFRKNLFLFLLSICLIILKIKTVPNFLLRTCMFLSIGFMAFAFYFWRGFEMQSYYLVNLAILPLLTVMVAFDIFIKMNIKPMLNNGIKLFFLAFVLVSIYDAKIKSRVYYQNGWRHAKLAPAFYDENLQKQILSIGIKAEDKVISIPDFTPNGSLVMLNRKGWSDYGFGIPAHYTDEAFDDKIKKGAKYLVISDTTLFENKGIKKYLSKPVGNYKGLHFFKI